MTIQTIGTNIVFILGSAHLFKTSQIIRMNTDE